MGNYQLQPSRISERSADPAPIELSSRLIGAGQRIYVPIRHSADQGTNIRLRLRCSFRLLSFGYVLNDDLRLTQPTRAAQPSNEIPLYTCRDASTDHLFLCKTNPISEKVK